MPISNHIDVARGTVFSTFSGAVTVEEVRALAEALRDDPDFRPDLNQMIDLRATEVAISTDDIKGLARESQACGADLATGGAQGTEAAA